MKRYHDRLRRPITLIQVYNIYKCTIVLIFFVLLLPHHFVCVSSFLSILSTRQSTTLGCRRFPFQTKKKCTSILNQLNKRSTISSIHDDLSRIQLRISQSSLLLSSSSSSLSSKTNDNMNHNGASARDDIHSMTAQEISDQMQGTYLLNYDWKQFKSQHQQQNNIPPASTYSALCLVPPDEVWDTIQQARHLAQDKTLYRWPPAIRLFHPFARRPYLVSAASAISEIIEQFMIEPFEITLDNLVIRPYWEAMEQIMELEDRTDNPPSESASTEELSDVEKLIQSEERKGRERYKRRITRKNKRQTKPKQPPFDKPATTTASNKENDQRISNKQNLTNKKAINNSDNEYDYNGPCIICLDPCEESKLKLHKLRTLLKNQLFAPYDSFSFSSSLSEPSSTIMQGHGDDSTSSSSSSSSSSPSSPSSSFIPTITLGTFPTTHSAVQLARKLQDVWEPLSFNVTDIHLMSRNEDTVSGDDLGTAMRSTSTNTNSNGGTEQEEDQYECDAMIMLMGEDNAETHLDNETAETLLSLLLEAGEDGGGATAAGSGPWKTESPEEKRWREEREFILKSMLEEEEHEHEHEHEHEIDYNEDTEENENNALDQFWFDDEDEDDWKGEGATIVLGRTQFFLGEMRLYVGMPACNPGVSTSSEGKTVVRRKREKFNDGDFGERE